MAADGAWADPANAAGLPAAQSRDAAGRLRDVVARIEAQLAAPHDPSPTGAASALLDAVAALERRLSRTEAEGADRYAELARAVQVLADRLEAQVAAGAGVAARVAQAEAKLAAAPQPPPAEPGPLRLLMTLACGAAVVAVAAAGAILVTRPQTVPPPLTRPVAGLPLRPGLSPPQRPAPQPATTGTGREPPPAPPRPTEPDQATDLARLTVRAEAGDSGAAAQLGRLYETGGPGVPSDIAAARAWTERAARAGDRLAMHNLALFLMNAEGGARDEAQAAQWFRRAAEQGVVDSQYNLGLLYEAGRGVARDLHEAYRWFSIAANAGDLAAREKQVAIEGRLAGAERAGLEREAADFRPGVHGRAAEPVPIIPPATTLAETQALLARQGYYVGPADGVATPALRTAATAWRRDHPGPGTP